jgi:hypothetical protein
MKVRELLSLVKNVKKTGEGWTAKCPSHEDERPSLSINEGEDGRVLIKCFAGCSVEQVIQTLNLSIQDLFSDRSNEKARIVSTYDYTDEKGALLFQVVRFEPKDFRARRPDVRGGWTWNLEGVRRVLYRLPDLLRTERVLIVEGEKDVEALVKVGLTATCNPGGAGKWREDFSRALQGKEVVILPDNDEPGQKHAEQVAGSLHGIAKAVKVLNLPGLPPKGDVSDWLSGGETREGLLELAENAPEWKADHKRSGLILTSMKEFLREPEEKVSWVLDQRLPSGGLSILAGKPKAGKDTTARSLALAVSRGEPFLNFATQHGPVFYLGLEEKRAEVKEHFRAMGAREEDPIFVFVASSPVDGLEQLRRATEKERPVLIIVSPLLKFIRVRDANDYATMSNSLEPLTVLVRETGAHLLAVHHAGKGERSGGDVILGSTAIFGAVDTALILKRTDRYRTLSSMQRYGEDLEEITLAFDPVTRRVTAGLPRKEADQAEMEEAIIEFLKGQEEPVEEKIILEGVEGRHGIKVKALRNLVGNKKVFRSGKGGKSDPFKYSCSLVPDMSWEQENKNQKNAGSNGNADGFSCSRENGLFDGLGTRNKDPGNKKKEAPEPPIEDEAEFIELEESL